MHFHIREFEVLYQLHKRQSKVPTHPIRPIQDTDECYTVVNRHCRQRNCLEYILGIEVEFHLLHHSAHCPLYWRLLLTRICLWYLVISGTSWLHQGSHGASGL